MPLDKPASTLAKTRHCLLFIVQFTVVSEIFTGCHFREFRDKGQVCENLFMKLTWMDIKWLPFYPRPIFLVRD